MLKLCKKEQYNHLKAPFHERNSKFCFYLYLTIFDDSYYNVAILIYYLFRFCSNASHITSSKRLKSVSLSSSPVISWQIISSQHQCLTYLTKLDVSVSVQVPHDVETRRPPQTSLDLWAFFVGCTQ